jgi:hypothetical protein
MLMRREEDKRIRFLRRAYRTFRRLASSSKAARWASQHRTPQKQLELCEGNGRSNPIPAPGAMLKLFGAKKLATLGRLLRP